MYKKKKLSTSHSRSEKFKEMEYRMSANKGARLAETLLKIVALNLSLTELANLRKNRRSCFMLLRFLITTTQHE